MSQSCPLNYTTKSGLRKQKGATTDTAVCTAMAIMFNVGKKQWQKGFCSPLVQRFMLKHRISPTAVQLREVCSFTFLAAYYINQRKRLPVFRIRCLGHRCYQTTSQNWAILHNQNKYFVVFVFIILPSVLIMDSWCFDAQVHAFRSERT